MNEPIAHLNGVEIPVSEARLHVFDLGVVAGASVTEQIRTFRHRPFRLREHLLRLAASLRALGRTSSVSLNELESIVDRIIVHNAKLIPAHHDLGVVVFITLGKNLTYLGAAGRSAAREMSVCVHTFPLPFELWTDKLDRGQHLVTPATRAIPNDCLDPQIKSRNRLHWAVADQQARLADPEAVALVLDHQGNIAETSAANFFLVRDNTIVTPPIGAALNGVTQSVVQELAEASGIDYVAAKVQVFDALNADEAFTASTPSCLLPVVRLNGVPIGAGKPGPVFEKLASAWDRLVGFDWRQQARQAAADRTASTGS